MTETPGWEHWRHLDARTPVIVGVGRAGQWFDEPGAGETPLGLMVAAALDAGADSGAPDLLRRVERVAVPEGSWSYHDAAGLVARAVGAEHARTVILRAGIPQQTLFDDAYLELLAGHIDVALVVGGEAAHRAVTARRAGVELHDAAAGDDTEPDELRSPQGDVIITPVEIAAGVVTPALQYALIDSALRHAEGRTIAEHRDEIARLWAGFSEVAAGFPFASFREPRTAEWIRDPGPDNRPIAFPYNKWHCSQMNVDQSAALLLCTLAAAEAAGVDPARVVFPLVALESSFSVPVLLRRDLHRWPAMEVLGQTAVEHLGAPLAAVEYAELYSCFPAAVRVQQRALHLPVDGVPTITGGEPFAGGPWNNFVLQTTVAMVEKVRAEPGSRGLVTTVSGFLNKPGLAVYSTVPGDRPLLVADMRERAEAATAAVPLAAEYRGPATVATYTVSAEKSGESRVIVIADTPAGERCLATSVDAALASRVTTAELIGTEVTVDGPGFHL